MATRRNVNNPTRALEELIKIYVGTKGELDPLKKLVEDYNKRIKEEMKKLKINEFTVGDIKASISVTENYEFNELHGIELLRDALKPEQFKQVVKTKEYIDDEALEKLVYNHEVDATILAPAQSMKKPTVTLRIGKAKK